jgi:hypothetical protein
VLEGGGDSAVGRRGGGAATSAASNQWAGGRWGGLPDREEVGGGKMSTHKRQ